MIRVLHVVSGLKVGGAEMVLQKLISSSEQCDYSHKVISLTPEGAMRERFDSAGIKLVVFDFKRSPISHFFRLVSLIKKSRPDVIQTWMYHADLLGGLAARMAGCRNIIWGIRRTDVKNASYATSIIRMLCAWLSRFIPHMIVCAAEASRRSHQAIGYDGSRMVVVPNGFDLSHLVATLQQREFMRKQYGFGAEAIVIGYVSRFHPDKDPQNFVLAAGKVAQHYSNAWFLMVGRDLDANNMQLMTWITDTGSANRFVLLGERTDVPVCLAAMDLFCLSSRSEGFPNVVGEAMAMGLPCVATNVGDAAMLVDDTGVIVPSEDSIALAQGLGQLLGMTMEERRRLGELSRERIRNEFTIDRMRNHFEDIYQQITKEG